MLNVINNEDQKKAIMLKNDVSLRTEKEKNNEIIAELTKREKTRIKMQENLVNVEYYAACAHF